ncbi:Gfo/Idh/MocA family protein [Streptomyces sp. NPDC057302]|uniref:Gfo/Idh/MocA family protein n=1 Tax=Streptomyces sp. NPDC057302 TaxID=3346094 RepID=UPI00363B2071
MPYVRGRGGPTHGVHDHPPRQEPPRIIVVGAGLWGPKLGTVCSRQALLAGVVTQGGEQSARWLGRDHPALAVMTDLDAVLADDRLDAVVVAMPSTSLAPVARRALEARRDVLVERPVATDAATVRDLADLARATGRTLLAVYTYLFDPAFDALLRMTEGDPMIDQGSAASRGIGSEDADLAVLGGRLRRSTGAEPRAEVVPLL